MPKFKDFTKLGLFVIFLLTPAFLLTGMSVFSDDIDNPIVFLGFSLTALMFLAWIIVVLTTFIYQPKRKNEKHN
jgi:4-hydroxybenzoate polyprenyltransferase